MRPRLIAVTGTGTEIGKTHLGVALTSHLARTLRVAAIKPVESGTSAPGALGDDAKALAAASSFHVKHPPPYALTRPVSPHLAARDAGITIDPAPILAYVAAADDADIVLVELPGGLFSPLAPALTNAHLIRALAPDVTLLVAPDRLGVLHDVAAATRAALAVARLDAVVLTPPATPDASTGTNAAELPLATALPIFGPLARAPVAALADHPVVAQLAAFVTR